MNHASMELPRIVHDELLYNLDEPQEKHMKQVLHAAEIEVPVKGLDRWTQQQVALGSLGSVSEHTPLLKPSPSGQHVLAVDDDKVEEILNAEEKQAIEDDAKLPAWTIISDEFFLLTKLAYPMILASLFEMIPDTVLMMMVGHVNPTESTQIIAGFNLSGLVETLLLAGLLNGLSSAIDTLCSQAYGGKRMVEFWLFCQAGLLMYAICMPFMMAVLLGGSTILKTLGQEIVISDIAGKFLLVTAPGVPFGVVFVVMRSALQAQNIVLPVVITSVLGWVVGGAAAYFLAFHTSLGYMGIALAEPLCSIVKTLVLIPVVLQSEALQESWPGWKPTAAMALVPKISKLGASSVLMVTLQLFGLSFISLLAGLLPNADIMITASNIFLSVIALTFVPLFGICISGAIRIGNALGAGKARRAALVGRVVVVGSVVVAAIGMATSVFVVRPYALAQTPNPQAIELGVELTFKVLPILPLIGFTLGLQSILRASGKQLLAAKFNFVCMFIVGVPLGLWFAMNLDLGLLGLWFGNMAGLVVFTIVGVAWLWTLNWEQLAHEAKHNTHLTFAKVPPAPAEVF